MLDVVTDLTCWMGFAENGVDERALTDLVSSGCSQEIGAVAQLGEHLLCKQGVSGSIPLSSTILCPDAVAALPLRSGRAAERSVPAFGLAKLCFV